MQGTLYKRYGLIWKQRQFYIGQDPVPAEQLARVWRKHENMPDIEDSDTKDAYQKENESLFNALATLVQSSSGFMLYYDDHQLLDYIDLAGVTAVEKTQHLMKPFSFIVHHDSNHEYHLSANSEADRDMWIAAINNNKHHAKASRSEEFFQKLVSKSAFDEPDKSLLERLMEHQTKSKPSVGVPVSSADSESPKEFEDVVQTEIHDAEEDRMADSAIDESVKSPVTANAEVPEVEQPADIPTEGTGLCGLIMSKNESFPEIPLDDAKMSGVLLKQSDYLKKWNRRFFILRPSDDGLFLTYFRPGGKSVAGKMHISNAMVIEPCDLRDNAFTITCDDMKYILSAETAAKRDEWFTHLQGTRTI